MVERNGRKNPLVTPMMLYMKAKKMVVMLTSRTLIWRVGWWMTIMN